jgi:hypothetical protein
MRNRSLLAYLFISIGLAVVMTCWIAQPLRQKITIKRYCADTATNYVAIPRAQVKEFRECAARRAKVFYERNYVEAKDLAKAFLTLLGGILVTSITFSEKIVNVHNASKVPLVSMLICWLSLLCSIAFTGSGLAWVAYGAGLISYVPEFDIDAINSYTIRSFILGGLTFGLALAAMIVAGIVSLTYKQAANQ